MAAVASVGAAEHAGTQAAKTVFGEALMTWQRQVSAKGRRLTHEGARG